MSYNFDRFEFTEESEVEFEEGEITTEERDWLRENGVMDIESYATNTGEVNRFSLDVDRLSQIAFEYDLLKAVASTVEVDVLEAFRRSNDQKMTTSEIATETGRPKSSVSRALSRLVDKGKIEKVHDGLYRY